MRDGLSVPCDDGVHEWCAVVACECSCHERPYTARHRTRRPGGGKSTERPRSGRRRRSRGGDPDTPKW